MLFISMSSFVVLSVLVDTKLRSYLDIGAWVNNSKPLLGLMKRSAIEFSDLCTSKRLIATLVRAALEYSVIV